MTMDLVERVAKRRHERKSMWPWDSVQDKRAKLAEVRADITEILDAMEQPSEEMLEAANMADRGMLPWKAQWQAMLAQFKAENVK